MSFSSDIANYAKKTNQSIEDAVTTINLELTRNVILKTPVDKGRLISNWQPSFGSASNTATLDKSSKQEKLEEVKKDAEKSAGKVFYLTNNLAYAVPIEYGHSKIKAPKGMVRTSIQDINNLLRKFKTTK